MRVAFAVAAIVAALAATGATGQGLAPRQPRVVATTTQITDLARRVAGTAARVDGILPANVDPHDYEPVPGDLAKIAAADLILENGLGLETWIGRLLRSRRPGVKIVVTTRGVPPRRGGPGSSEGDPHAWMAVPNAAIMVRNIRDALAGLDPAHAGTYRDGAAAYLAELAALDKEIFAQVGTIPPAQRVLVTSHEAFGYYAARYGLKLVGTVIPSVSTEAQASARHLAELVSIIRAQRVKAIFVESTVNPKLAAQVAREAGARVVTDLYGDSLGPAGSDGDTYIKMMRHNTRAIVAGLRGRP